IVEEELEATPYEYTVTYRPPPISRSFRFSPTEIRHLILSALLVIGVGLSLALQVPLGLVITPEILVSLALIFTFAFLIHELAHKLSAQRFGLWAEFRLTMFGALITLISIFLPFFKIISPGAVMIAGPIGKKVAGKTAIAGPLTNTALSIASLMFALYLINPPIQAVAMLSATFN
ncbi:MAG: hypothetical protein GWN86_31065, partial [Desulfobacterales bacterium]|nr:hypothetical protein [Desulfobacterales bacterium]